MPQTTQLVSVGVKIKPRQSGYRFCFLLLLPQGIFGGHGFALQMTYTLRRDREKFQKHLLNNQSLKCHKEGNSEKKNVLQIFLMLLGHRISLRRPHEKEWKQPAPPRLTDPSVADAAGPSALCRVSYSHHGPVNQQRQCSHGDKWMATVTLIQRVNDSSNYSKLFSIFYKQVFKMRYFNHL